MGKAQIKAQLPFIWECVLLWTFQFLLIRLWVCLSTLVIHHEILLSSTSEYIATLPFYPVFAGNTDSVVWFQLHRKWSKNTKFNQETSFQMDFGNCFHVFFLNLSHINIKHSFLFAHFWEPEADWIFCGSTKSLHKICGISKRFHFWICAWA